MAANTTLQPRTGNQWWRGLGPLLRREHRLWWASRRWLVQTALWTLLLNGLLLGGLYLLPPIASADGLPMSHDDVLELGRQIFFGLGILALSLGAIVLLQDSIIEEKNNGTAEWVLSKPVSRPAYVLAKLLPNLLGMAVTMLLVSGIFGLLILRTFDPVAFSLSGFLMAQGIVALHLFFYITLTLMLGVLLSSRAPLLGIAIASLVGGSMIPVVEIVQFTPWILGELVVLPLLGVPPPPMAITMLVSTAVWSLIFIGIAIWQFNRHEF
ncbi:MAG: ABC transporter permease subunit [Chloroflexota bacterium]